MIFNLNKFIIYNSQISGLGVVIARNCFVNVHCITLIISAPRNNVIFISYMAIKILIGSITILPIYHYPTFFVLFPTLCKLLNCTGPCGTRVWIVLVHFKVVSCLQPVDAQLNRRPQVWSRKRQPTHYAIRFQWPEFWETVGCALSKISGRLVTEADIS
jgi:hypothetical protein